VVNRHRYSLNGFLLALPTILWLLIFFFAPLWIVLQFSFYSRGPRNTIITDFTDENYVYVTNGLYWDVFERSFEIALYTTLICLFIGYPVAYFISTRRTNAVRQISLFLVVLPFWTNFIVRTYAWRLLLAKEGIINNTLLRLGIIDSPIEMLLTREAVILGLVYGYLPFMILPIYASLARFNFKLVEAGQDLGGNDFTTFRKVVFPLTLPGVLAGCILVFVPSIGSYVTPDMLGGVQGRMIGNLIARNFSGTGHWPRGAATSMILMGIVTALLLIYVIFLERPTAPNRNDTMKKRLGFLQQWLGIPYFNSVIDPIANTFSQVRLWFWLPDHIRLARDRVMRVIGGTILRLTVLSCYLFLWLPIIVLIVFSFNDSRSTSTWHGFSARWYNNIANNVVGGEAKFSTTEMLEAFEMSLRIGAIATIAATIIGTACALSLARGRYWGKPLLLGALYITVAIPEIAQGISLLIYFERGFEYINATWADLFGQPLGLKFGLLTMILGHITFNIPYVAVIVWARLVSMNQNLEEAARDLGANNLQTFIRVTFPLALPGILGGALLAFTLSLDDYVISFFTKGISTDTLTIFVYGLLKQTVTPEINAISTLMITVSILLVSVSLIIQSRYSRQV